MDSYSNSNSDAYSCSYFYTYSDFILFPEEAFDTNAFDTNGIRRDQTREEVEVAEQAHTESSPQHEGSKPLSGEVEQSGNNPDGINNKCPATSLFGCDEDENPLKEKYTQEGAHVQYHRHQVCNPQSNQGYTTNPLANRPTAHLMGNPQNSSPNITEASYFEIWNEKMGLLNRPPKQQKEVYICEWLDKLPLCWATPPQSSGRNAE
ncbi:hypothetical protein KCU78_g9544, partial [Aureobasidium melanogenum]